MPLAIGEQVRDPRQPADTARTGVILDIETHPACRMRGIVVQWETGEIETLEEEEFGPLED